jgi:hypothetical protein
LQEEEEKSLLNSNKILKNDAAALFCMPSLEDESMKKIEEIERQAYEEGFAAGEKAGFTEGEQKAAVLIGSLHELLEKIACFKDELVDNLESQAVDLSICIARKVINEEVQTRPDVIVSMVKEALRRLQRTGTISVKINPVLHELFMEKKSELMEVHGDITFDVNSNIAVAGPLVVSQIEEVVTDVESLLDNVINEVTSGRTVKEPENNGDEISVATDMEVEEQTSEPETTDDPTIDKIIDDEDGENSEQN